MQRQSHVQSVVSCPLSASTIRRYRALPDGEFSKSDQITQQVCPRKFGFAPEAILMIMKMRPIKIILPSGRDTW